MEGTTCPRLRTERQLTRCQLRVDKRPEADVRPALTLSARGLRIGFHGHSTAIPALPPTPDFLKQGAICASHHPVVRDSLLREFDRHLGRISWANRVLVVGISRTCGLWWCCLLGSRYLDVLRQRD